MVKTKAKIKTFWVVYLMSFLLNDLNSNFFFFFGFQMTQHFVHSFANGKYIYRKDEILYFYLDFSIIFFWIDVV